MRREPASRRVALVKGHSARSKQHAVSQNPQPPAEVDVLEEREIILVESSRPEKYVASDRHGAAAWKKERGRLQVCGFFHRPAMPRLKAVPIEVDGSADEVDRLAI